MDDADKKKLIAAFEDPGGITLHAYQDRDGKWCARVMLTDGSSVYTPPHHTAHGLFTWFAENSMLVKMAAP